MKTKSPSSLIPIIVLVGFLVGSALLVNGIKDKDRILPQRDKIPRENQGDLKDDSSSISTIIYGVKSEGSTLVSAINDSGINNTAVAKLAEEVKYLIPLSNGRQIIYIADTDTGDVGGSLQIKNIVPDGSTNVIYTPTDGYRIDSLIMSSDNKWISWHEVKPPDERGYTHRDDYFRVYKARLENISKLSPVKISEVKSGPGVEVDLPSIITNSGKVYLNSVIPSTYALFTGYKDEQKNVVLPINTYNNNPQLVDQKHLLYTSFEPSNSKFPPTGDTDSTRDQVLNTNIVKMLDTENNEITIVAPGNEGEHYKHPVFVSGSVGGKMEIVSEIYTLQGSDKVILVAKEIQLIRKLEDGTFEKKKIADITDKRQRILGVGQLPNGDKTVILGEDSAYGGNLGTGNGIGASGYTKKLLAIEVYNLSTKSLVRRITPESASIFEYISIAPKLANEKLGIQRDKKLVEGIAKGIQQLQLQTFVPVEPKRVRKNPRSECELEWQKKGYPNYEACEACPVYVYSPDNRKIRVIPSTPIVKSSAIPRLINDQWNFTANKNGVLNFSDGNYKKIDYDFPRGSVKTPDAGIILNRVNREHEIADYAYKLGYNTREVEDIVEFFIEQLNDNEYVFFSNISQIEVNNLLKVNVEPKPDTYISHIFYAKKLSSKSEINVLEPSFNLSTRNSYSVVVWGSVIE